MDTDVIHNFGNHIDWSESFYFNFYDKGNDIFAFMRLGLKPNSKEKNMFCFFMMPDGSVVGSKNQDEFIDTSLNVKGLRFEKVESEKLWKLNYLGNLNRFRGALSEPEKVLFSIEFESLNKVFNYRECVSGKKEEISKSIASEHLEQFGRARGTLIVGDKQYNIDGLGERDHSWGVRDWNAPRQWIWLTCQFSETSALNVTKLTVDQGDVDAGFIHIDGENIPLIKVNIDTTYNDDGSPQSLTINLSDKRGISYKVAAEVLRKAAVPFTDKEGKKLSIMHETLAKYTYGEKVGYGVAEYLVRKTR